MLKKRKGTKKNMTMSNNFEEKYKEVDLSSIDVDSYTFDRKYLELQDNFLNKVEFVESFHSKEYDLANNNSDEMYRRIKLAEISSDFRNSMERLLTEYENDLKELLEKYEKKTSYPYYYKWMFKGMDSSLYPELLNGLVYFIKKLSDDEIEVYNDCKFSSHIQKYPYRKDDWTEISMF